MDIDIKTWLYDMLNAINEIEVFLTGSTDDFTAFQHDLKTRRAVERNIEIIGEAMGRVLKRDPNFQLPNSRAIVDTRNRIIHGYDSVSDEIIWGIVINHLPALKNEIQHLLDE